MKLSQSVLAISFSLHSPARVAAFSNSNFSTRSASFITHGKSTSLLSLAVAETEDLSSAQADLDFNGVNKLSFRELQKNCKDRGLPASGNTAALRRRLLEAIGTAACTEESGENDEVSHYLFIC